MPSFRACSKQSMGDIRQEAQRLGRILRPKPQATTTAGGFNVPWFAMRSKGTRSKHRTYSKDEIVEIRQPKWIGFCSSRVGFVETGL